MLVGEGAMLDLWDQHVGWCCFIFIKVAKYFVHSVFSPAMMMLVDK